jgi:hypothetical protein
MPYIEGEENWLVDDGLISARPGTMRQQVHLSRYTKVISPAESILSTDSESKVLIDYECLVNKPYQRPCGAAYF